jgi:DNA-binding NtrC family response regulator
MHPKILIAEGHGVAHRALKELLRRLGFEVSGTSEPSGVLRSLQEKTPDLVIIDAPREGAWDGVGLARQIRQRDRQLPIILITAQSSEEMAIVALRAGITDYFKQPLCPEEVVAAITRCIDEGVGRAPAARHEAGRSGLLGGDRLVGDSPSLTAVKAYIGRVAATGSNVLITGETGTGKELVAHLIHENSPRAKRPFMSINCAAIPDSLLESELFGHERGAFTGAHAQKEGVLNLANEGTAFFDEIGDMSGDGQAKILRAIDSKEVRRLGGRGSIPLDIRIVAATNQDLEERVAEGKFRQDLYYRLNVTRIHLPPLRDRKEDIPVLFDHYIREMNHRFGRQVEGFSNEALECLLRYQWPGNVRELRNLLEAVFVNLPPRMISFVNLPEQFRRRLCDAAVLPRDERERLLSALFSTRWNKSQAAQKLHWSRMTLYRKMAKYRIVKAGGRPSSAGE